MSKCEWKDEMFFPCEELWVRNLFGLKFCPFCGADIRKPVIEPRIKRSGETFVCRAEGKDWLFTAIYNGKETPFFRHPDNNQINLGWKAFSEIEITDAIAKLRPIIAVEDCDYCSILIHVNEGTEYKYTVIEPSGAVNRFVYCRLATVEDLED